LEKRQSHTLVRSIIAGGVAVITVTALAWLAGGVLAFNGSSVPSAAQYQYGQKVTICHHTHSKKHPTVTITVSTSALKAHMRHGDTIGPCSSASAKAKAKAKAAATAKAAAKANAKAKAEAKAKAAARSEAQQKGSQPSAQTKPAGNASGNGHHTKP
jgi:hypothetical protein